MLASTRRKSVGKHLQILGLMEMAPVVVVVVAWVNLLADVMLLTIEMICCGDRDE